MIRNSVHRIICLIGVAIAFAFSSCDRAAEQKPGNTLFTLLDESHTGIDFVNTLTFDQKFNIYTYRNFYNGGGVGIGDINNDGLVDVYLTANQAGNRLYLNKGNLQFEDITEKAGVKGQQNWSTGVSLADVNGDGLVDIYVCSSGNVEGDPDKQNELFINNGDLTFTERAKEFGVADKGYSTHAAFFDYDKDGDLDLYILNNSYQAIGSFNLRKNIRDKRDPLGGHKLLRNDNNKFVDVSEQAGIFGSVIGFGLGVTVGDINKDGWLDIFVSNDFFERDYLYINNKNGTFRECLPEQMRSISGASMGADLADINNDAWSDLFVTEMLPHDNNRLKTVTTFEDWNRYQYNLSNGYYHQFTRNMLQLNNGDGTFSEIGRLAGVEATDWSWGALIFDMNNDGRKDIFVANGIYQDLTNQDFLQFASNEEFVKSVLSNKSVDYKKLTEIIPSNPIANFAFENNGDLRFADRAETWGLGTPGFSNGAAYADLDNDGDMDLVVNNVNMPCFVYRNESNAMLPQNRYLKFELEGDEKNKDAIGTRITVEAAGQKFFVEQVPIRGFESTVDARPNLGLGTLTVVDRILVEWPNDSVTVLENINTNQTLKLQQKEAVASRHDTQPAEKALMQPANLAIDFVHKENEFVDFNRDYLVYHMLSTEGPRMSKGDVNRDGLDDFYVGGARGSAGALFIQQQRGGFVKSSEAVFAVDADSEDLGSEFFDADGDGDLDLYVCSGGNEFSSSSAALIDRLYLNNGKGVFKKSEVLLPEHAEFESNSTVRAVDFDGDGDQDLFVGARVRPFIYGPPVSGHLLANDGKGKFTDVTANVAPQLKEIGMITDAAWSDIDGDKDQDLVLVGEYMPVTRFVNEKGKFSMDTIASSSGWWNRIEAGDLDNDGDTDFVLSNHGLNSRFRADVTHPVQMYVNDFDQNGTVEHFICTYQGDKSFPLALKHELVNQIPSLKKKYLRYENYKNQTINDIFGEAVKSAIKLEAVEMRSVVLMNDKGTLTMKPLPLEAQLSVNYGIEIKDFNGDKKPDILLGGNLFETKPQVGRYDASYGTFLAGNGDGTFEFVPAKDSGFRLDGAVRDIIAVTGPGKKPIVIVSRNKDSLLTYTLSK